MTPAKATEANAPHATLWEALSAFQGAVPTITKDKTATVTTKSGGQYQYHYAGLDSVMEVVRPILAEHGLAWYALPGLDEHGQNVLQYFLVHGGTGEKIGGVMPLLVEERTGSSSTQALGSAITYARRYAMTSVLNLVTEDDDDGRAAGNPPKAAQSRRTGASDAQRKMIHDLAQKKGVGREALGKLAGVTVEEGWMDKLTPGKTGSASALIDTLMKLQPPPEPEPPRSDVPDPEPGEFEQPPLDETADLPFDPDRDGDPDEVSA